MSRFFSSFILFIGMVVFHTVATADDFSDGVHFLQNNQYEEAFIAFSKAAKNEDMHALYLMGIKYEVGLGVKPDKIYAKEWYRRAAEQGYIPSRHNFDFFHGNPQDLLQKRALLVQRYQTSAQKGDPDAQYLLGRLYQKGEGITQSDLHAAAWYKKAAEQNHSEAKNRLKQEQI